MGKIRLDERGRILIPFRERKKLGLKPNAEFELVERGGTLILIPVIRALARVKSKKEEWGKEAFLDAGEATFGE